MQNLPLIRWGACVLLASSAAGCADRSPVASSPPAAPAPGPLTSRLECRADLARRTVECTAAAASGPRANLFVGGQDVYVKLRTINVEFAAGVLSADLTLQNLLSQPMGTTDGTTPTPEGVRVFFASGPTTTGGSGTVTVQNPDGVGVFTATGQPYFEYPGVLGPGETSGAKSWQFQVDPGVSTFSFTLYVSAALPAENGWIDLFEPNPVLAPGQSVTLEPRVFTATAAPVEGVPVAWASSDLLVATVSGEGEVTAVALGTATITATSGGRTGHTLVTVADLDLTAPLVSGVTASPDPVNAGDTVTLSVTATDAGVGMARVSGTLSRGDRTARCSGTFPNDTIHGAILCRLPIAPGAEAGAWTLWVSATDRRGNVSTLSSAQLATAGFASNVIVADDAPDATGPELTGLSVSPTNLDAGDPATVTATVTDVGTGVARVTVGFRDPGDTRQTQCVTTEPATGTANDGTWVCAVPFPPGTTPGVWVLTAVVMEDLTGNRTFASSVAPDLPPTVTVVSPAPDSIPPTLRSLSMNPTAAPGDSVALYVGVADLGSGVDRVAAVFRSPHYFQLVACERPEWLDGTPAYGTMVCAFGPPADVNGTGTWTLLEVVITDRTGNARSVLNGELQALGYPTTIDIAP